jgi:SAM-dependent methyltransferase
MSSEDSRSNMDRLKQEAQEDAPDRPASPGMKSVSKSSLPVDEIMARVRAEIARRRDGQPGIPATNVPTSLSSGESLPRWQAAAPRLPFKREYVLPELLVFSDADFIDVAYRTVLRRPPDEAGFKHTLAQLRSGTATKVEILWTLRESAEGQARGVVIHGLRQPYLLQKWRRKRFFGPIIGWAHAFLRLGAVGDRLAALDTAQARESQELGRMLNEVSEHLVRRIAILKDEHAAVAAGLQTLLAREERAKEEARALDAFYGAFEDRFRGDRAAVRARAEPYLELVREVGAGTSEAPVIDLGCGRGEWLELLRDHGLIGRGVDNNRVFLEMCRGRGLEVIEGDAIENLRATPEASVGAVTSIHLVEHIPFERLIALLDEARRVLRPGGMILLETPNPENLWVAHHFFYMDPTHRNPIPPETLRFIVEARGFYGARIERLTVARELHAPPLLAEDVPGAASMNVLLASLNVAADYAVVARRL